MLFTLGMVGGVRMKVGDLVKIKSPMGSWRGFGIIVGYPEKDSPWSDCVRIDWYSLKGAGNRNALHRIFDLEPVL